MTEYNETADRVEQQVTEPRESSLANESNEGRQDLVSQQKQTTADLKSGKPSGITNEFGKPVILEDAPDKQPKTQPGEQSKAESGGTSSFDGGLALNPTDYSKPERAHDKFEQKNVIAYKGDPERPDQATLSFKSGGKWHTCRFEYQDDQAGHHIYKMYESVPGGKEKFVGQAWDVHVNKQGKDVDNMTVQVMDKTYRIGVDGSSVKYDRYGRAEDEKLANGGVMHVEYEGNTRIPASITTLTPDGRATHLVHSGENTWDVQTRSGVMVKNSHDQQNTGYSFGHNYPGGWGWTSSVNWENSNKVQIHNLNTDGGIISYTNHRNAQCEFYPNGAFVEHTPYGGIAGRTAPEDNPLPGLPLGTKTRIPKA